MSSPRALARTAAVFGAATALTVAGASAALATTHESTVDGDTVSTTFELDGGVVESDTCGAALVPTAAAPALAQRLADGSIEEILETLVDDENVTVLETSAGLPVVVLGALAGGGITSGTVSADDVPSNIYALVSFCTSDDEPTVNAPVLVGDPVEAITGSIGTASAGGGLEAGSALLEGGLGGDEDGGPLGSLTGVLGGEVLGDTGSAADGTAQE